MILTKTLFWRALLAFLALPAMVAFVLPWLLRPSGARLHATALPFLALGATCLLWCVRDFYVAGRGTLAPWAPPTRLVTVGLYRFSRNPMYVAVVLILASWAVGFGSLTLTVYAAGVALAFHLRVVMYEERWLDRTFDEDWRAYRARVPRWMGRPTTSPTTRIVPLVLILSPFLGSCDRRPWSGEPSRVAQRLLADSALDWHTVTVPGARLHLARGGAADHDSAAIVDSIISIRRDLAALLGQTKPNHPARPADLFFLSSREQMRRLAGRPLAGFIQQGEPTGVFVVTLDYRYGSLLRHELAHLHTFEAWEPPAAGRWFVEGVAAWAAGSCQGHTSDALTAGALTRGALPTLTELANNFDRVAEDVAMPQAASVIGFLVRHEGMDGLRRRWREAPGALHPLGPNGAALEGVWREELRGVTPARLDIPRLLAEGC